MNMPPEQPAYYRLTVKSIKEETNEAKSFVLQPDRADAEYFSYLPGQFLTFKIPNGSGFISRSYSLSSSPGADADMMICVKRIADGKGSNWFNDKVTVGTRLEAKPPAGRFVLREHDGPLFLLAGGSGITPCLALIKQALMRTKRSVKLLYANRNSASTIYRDRLDMLCEHFADRLTIQYWLDEDGGFLKAEHISSSLMDWEESDIYVCGPASLMDIAEQTMTNQLGPDAPIFTERFVSPSEDPVTEETDAVRPTDIIYKAGSEIGTFKLVLDGVHVDVPYFEGQTLLDAAVHAKIDAPFSCLEGHCGTCMAHLKDGQVTMMSTKALSKRNLENGLILTCQAKPAANGPLIIDFDI